MGKAQIKLSDHFDYKRLLQFALPTVAMTIFTSIYGVVDGFFVSNFVGKTAFAAINFIMPVIMIIGAVGGIFGAGGSALVAKTLGEGDREAANRLFSLFVYVPAVCGSVLALAGFVFIPQIAQLLGAQGALLDNCILYARISMVSVPAYMLQYAFQNFFVTAEKPHLGFAVTVGAGVANIVLDALFIAGFHWGVAGAAAATAASEFVGGIVPCVYFGRKNASLLKLGRARIEFDALLKAATNGSSEFVTNIAISVVSVLYNMQLLRYAGENGVAAYGVLMYVNFIFHSMLFGYSMGTAPLFAYHYGAQTHDELHNLFVRSLKIIGILSVVLFAAAELLARPMSLLFVGYDAELMALTISAFRIYSFSFLLVGFNIFSSAFFTALNNGLISAFVSFMRTLVFETGAVLLLPLFLGVRGIWNAIIVAECAAFILAVVFVVANRKKYHY